MTSIAHSDSRRVNDTLSEAFLLIKDAQLFLHISCWGRAWHVLDHRCSYYIVLCGSVKENGDGECDGTASRGYRTYRSIDERVLCKQPWRMGFAFGRRSAGRL